MLSRFVRAQLLVFSVVTIFAMAVMFVKYVKVPAMFGLGTINVVIQLPSSGGLYKHANVTYRGTTVGEVQSVQLTEEGVEATLTIEDDVSIPASISAQVKSVSAIGEQYVDLVPQQNISAERLHEGAVISLSDTTVPQEVGPMIEQANNLVSSISNTKLRALVDNAFAAFGGTGSDFQKLIDSTRLFVQEANKNSEVTLELINNSDLLLDTQISSRDSLREWTSQLAVFTDQLRANDQQLNDIIEHGPSTASTARGFFEQLEPTLPLLLANLVSVGEVSVIYHKSIEQLLVLFPPLTSMLFTAAANGPAGEGALVDFHLQLNDPPACTTGFLLPEQRRDPSDTSLAVLPNDLFCKVGQSDPVSVRGARNLPCMEVPGKRAPSPSLCRDPQGYVPLGTNPAYGPPQPTDKLWSGATAARQYDPKTGKFTGPDGKIYTYLNALPDQEVKGGESSWQEFLIPAVS
ncbi:MAG: MCE family protein [Mycobacteriaceae bacterium]